MSAGDFSTGATVLAFGASAIGGSYLFQYLYNVMAERAVMFRKTPKFTAFGRDLQNFLSNQPNREAMVLVEGSVEQYDNKVLSSLKGEYTGAGKVVQTTEYFKSRVENTENTWRDTSRSTENVRASVPFALRDNANNVVIVKGIHNAIGFDQLLQLACQEHITDKGKTSGDFATAMLVQEIPISTSTHEYLLVFGTMFGGYGRAALSTTSSTWFGGNSEVVTFYPEEVGSSIRDLIYSQELVACTFRWLSWILFVGGGCALVLFTIPFVWKVIHGRSSRHNSTHQLKY